MSADGGAARLVSELRAALARMETALDSIPEGLVWTDAQGRVEWCNVGFERLVGRARIECLGKPWSSVCPLIPTRKAEGVFTLARAAGPALVEIDESPVPGAGGARVFVLRDVGPRLEMELELRENARELEIKNRELNAFAYTAAHDLRAPVRQIEAWAVLLVRGYASGFDERGRELLARIGESAERMNRLINGLLEIATLATAKPEKTALDLSKMARELADWLSSREPGRRVSFTAQPGLKAQGDEMLVRSLLGNLLENAWKFTARVAEPRVEFGREPDGAFFVRDNGAGFDMEFQDKLFTPFQRLHSQAEFPGTGIGLAAVRRVVELHGGRISAESKPGAGATFRFTLGT